MSDDELQADDDELVETSAPSFQAWLTAEQAATATGRSARTIRRKAAAGAIPGAEQDREGAWRIPATGLAASGLLPTDKEQVKRQVADQADDDELVARLREQVKDLTLRLEHQTELADERKQALARADITIRMLTGSAVAETTKEKRRRWRRS